MSVLFKEPESKLLPSWLAAFERYGGEDDSSVTNTDIKAEFEETTKQISSKGDLRSLWHNEIYLGLDPPWKSRAIFRRLLETNSKYLLIDFLKDAELGLPVVRNIDTAISEFHGKQMDQKTSNLLIFVVQKLLGLNLIPFEKVKWLLSNIGIMLVKVRDSPNDREQMVEAALYQLWRGLLRGASAKNSKPALELCQILLYNIHSFPYSKLLIRLRCEVLLITSNYTHRLLGTENISDLLALLAIECCKNTNSDNGNDRKVAPSKELIDMLNMHPKIASNQIVQSVTARLISSIQLATKLDKSNQHQTEQLEDVKGYALNNWLSCVQHCIHFHNEKYLSSTIWQDLFWTIFTRVEPSAIGSFLYRNFTDLDVAQIIFQNRFRSILTQRLQGSRDVGRAYRQAEQVLRNEILDSLSNSPVLGVEPFVLISSTLYACALPRQKIEEEIIYFIFHTKGYLAVSRYIIAMRKNDLFVHPHTLRNVIINLASINPKSAVRISLLSEYVNLPHIPDLPVAAAGKGVVSPDEAFKLLKRIYSTSHDLTSTNTSVARTKLLSEKAIILHKMATAFAFNQCLAAGRAFRAVYRCYRHLCTMQVAPGPAVAKAFVHAGIIRFLKSNRWVSTIKLRWVLGVVRASESKETADRVDQMVWIWRGHVIERRLAKAAARRKLRRQAR